MPDQAGWSTAPSALYLRPFLWGKAMRIAAMAAGAVGGYFGARMAAAGHEVFFIARGADLAAIKANGLKIESVHGDLHLPQGQCHR